MDLTELGNNVLRAVNKYEYDMAFTAPELRGMRMEELKAQVADLFEQAVEESDGEEVSA